MATKSQVVSWMGVALGVVQGLCKEVQKLGGTDEDVRKLVTPESESLLAEFAKKLVGTVKLVFNCSPIFDRDMTAENWKLEEDTHQKTQWDQGDFTPKLVEFLKEEEFYITGKEMEKRAKEHRDLAGQRHLEAMLRNQERIPVEWRKFVLVAPETVWVYSHGSRIVPCLYWSGGQWLLDFRWIGHNFLHCYRFVRLSK